MGFRYQFLRGDLPENDAYGHRGILSDYCSKGHKIPVFGRIQHGWGVGSYWDDDRIPSFVWSKNIENSARQLGFKNFFTIGAPFLYMKWHQNESKVSKKMPLLVVPHSTFTQPNRFTAKSFLRFSAKVLSEVENKPRFLFYWKDLTPEIQTICEKLGITSLTAGDGIYGADKEAFLYKVRSYINESSEVISGELGSTLFYAAYLGKKIRLLDQNANIANLRKPIEEIIRSKNVSDEEKNAVCLEEIGLQQKKTPEELLEILGASNPLLSNKRRISFIYKSFSNLLLRIN